MRKTRESRRAPLPGDEPFPRDVWYVLDKVLIMKSNKSQCECSNRQAVVYLCSWHLAECRDWNCNNFSGMQVMAKECRPFLTKERTAIPRRGEIMTHNNRESRTKYK